MEKENLVLLHSFPTNSILLRGLIEYLSDYFNVYFIDLPGFTKQVPPLPNITFEGYYDFVEGKIREFNLGHFLVGGISFGFAIVNHLDYDSNCKGIIAIEPFIGVESLKWSARRRAFFSWLMQIICSLKLYTVVWGSRLLKEHLPRLRNYPPGTIDIMLEQIDGRTFFETANILLKDRSRYIFHDLPYALVANKDDRSVNYDYIYNILIQNVKKLRVFDVEIDHYPKDTSKAYFKRMVPEEVFERIVEFFSSS